MSLGTLQLGRFFIPAIIFVLFTLLLKAILEGSELSLPDDLAELTTTLPVVVIAVLYYVFPFRNWSNNTYFQGVSENLRSGLLDAVEMRKNDENEWKEIRKVFFRIVDNDTSLQVHSQRAMFNGLIWTSLADIRAISLIFLVLSAVLLFVFKEDRAFGAGVIFLLLFFLTFPFSKAVTKKHMAIGNEQVSIIKKFHLDELKSHIGSGNE